LLNHFPPYEGHVRRSYRVGATRDYESCFSQKNRTKAIGFHMLTQSPTGSHSYLAMFITRRGLFTQFSSHQLPAHVIIRQPQQFFSSYGGCGGHNKH